jgi:hypothetical protein
MQWVPLCFNYSFNSILNGILQTIFKKIMNPKVNENINEVILFLSLWAIKFLCTNILVLLFSNINIIYITI